VTISLRTLAVCPADTAGTAREPGLFNVLADPRETVLARKRTVTLRGYLLLALYVAPDRLPARQFVTN